VFSDTDATCVFIFDEHFIFSDQLSSHSTSCYCYIRRQLRGICPYIESSILKLQLPQVSETRISRLQQNSVVGAVLKASKSSHTTPLLSSLHLFKIT